MKSTRLALAVLFTLAGASALSAQRARGASAPREGHGAAFVAPRYHEELTSGPTSGGVRLAGDVDKDGDVDLILLGLVGVNGPSSAQTWLNDGHGNFQRTRVLGFATPLEDGYFFLAQHIFLADVTGDGVLDLVYDRKDVFQQVGPSGVFVHPGLGDGGFGVGLFLDTNGIVQDFVVGDCDGDGDADLLIHHSNTGSDYKDTLVWWHLQGGSFVASAALPVEPEAPLSMSTFDLDGDGITDALAGTFNGYDTLQIFRTVSGAPTLFQTIPLPGELHDINQRFHTGDLDGDGDDDVLATVEDLDAHVFYLQPILNSPAGLALRPLQSMANDPIEPPLSRAGVLADWDEDGDLDYVSPTFSWLENTGRATFALAGREYMPASGSSFSALQVVDLDGDGHLDAIADWGTFRGDGRMPRVASVPSWDSGNNYTWTRVEDWEGDGDLDLVAPSNLQLNNGDGIFEQRFTALPPAPPETSRMVAWGDFDGDGLRDAVGAAFVPAPFPILETFVGMRFFTGDESGAFHPTAIIPSPVEMDVATDLVGDLDGDGDVDILTTNGVWLNDGAAHFGSAKEAAFAGLPLVLQDIDGDSDLDLLVGYAGRLHLLTNLGALAFQLTDVASYSGGYAGSLLASLLDADEDGDLDIVTVQSGSSGVAVYERLAGGGFGPLLRLDAVGANGRVGQIDVDGDGRLDLVFGRQAPGNLSSLQLLSAWLRGAGLQFTERRDWFTREAPLAFGDLDGDGDRDAIGRFLVQNLRLDGAHAGSAVQYAQDGATSGTGGFHPVLGARGALRPSGDGAFVIGRGRGGAAGFLYMGTARAATSVGGVTILVQPQTLVRALTLGGTPGAAGAGTLTQHMPVSAALIGRTYTFQAVLVDPGAGAGFSATNGLEVRFGDWSPAAER